MDPVDELGSFLKILRPDFDVAGSQNPPDDEALDALETRLGITLPAFYRDVAKHIGSLVIVARDDVWPPAKPNETGPAWSFCYGVQLYAIGADVPEHLNIEVVSRKLQEETGVFRPIALKRFGDPMRYAFDPDGRVRGFDPRDPEDLSAPEDLSTLMLRTVRDLRKRCDAVKAAIATHGAGWRGRLYT